MPTVIATSVGRLRPSVERLRKVCKHLRQEGERGEQGGDETGRVYEGGHRSENQ